MSHPKTYDHTNRIWIKDTQELPMMIINFGYSLRQINDVHKMRGGHVDKK